LRWADVDLARGELVVRQQLVQVASAAPCPSCGQHYQHVTAVLYNDIATRRQGFLWKGN